MRFFATLMLGLLFLAVITGISISVFAPHLLQSASDRSPRVLRDISPDMAERLATPPRRLPDVVPDAPERPAVQPPPPKKLAQLLAEKSLSRGQPVFIRIFKESAELELFMQGKDGWTLASTWPICRWSGALGPKLKEGDGQSPEGFYVVTQKALNPKSNYHLSFNLGFPNAYDLAHGRTGSFLMVHGDCLSIGCYAMTDGGIEDIYGLVRDAIRAGQREVPVHVFPFRMTVENMQRHGASQWASYWANLKEGHDWFEGTRRPPKAYVCARKYHFADGTSPVGKCQAIVGM